MLVFVKSTNAWLIFWNQHVSHNVQSVIRLAPSLVELFHPVTWTLRCSSFLHGFDLNASWKNHTSESYMMQKLLVSV